MQLNTEGFVDEVLLFFSPEQLNDILDDIERGYNKAENLFHLSVEYGLSLAQAQICIEYFLQRIEEILGKPIEQIIKKYGSKKLTELLDSETLANLRNEFIEFVKNCPLEDRSPNELKKEKISRLYIAMHNFDMQDKLSNVFSNLVIVQAYNFFSYIIDENKTDEINFICDMIDNLSLDNITDDTATKYTKLVIFINDFMFRKNNITEFIDKSFSYTIETLYEISKDWSYFNCTSFVNDYNVDKPAIENYAKFLLDALQLILGHTIDLNCDKNINKLLEQEILDILKEETITFIKDCGRKFFDYKRIEEKYIPYTITENSLDYVNNNSFDIETPIYPISNERIKQAEQINILINYFKWLSCNNQSQISPEEMINISSFLNEILNINYDSVAINFISKFNSTKNLLSKIGKSATITIDEVYNFLIDFNKNFPNIIFPPIPKQEKLNYQQDLVQ